jgi:ferritin-like metal-binding protein YciE
MKTISDLEALFLYCIENLVYLEKQVAEAMPGIIEKAKHQSLKNALQHHLEVSKEHNSRLQKIKSLLHKESAASHKKYTFSEQITGKGIKGLIEETNELLSNNIDEDVIDAAIIGCVQKTEHYEICAYRTALAYARHLHLREAGNLLRQTLDEEYDADELLTALATAALNKEALPEEISNGNENSKEDSDDDAGKRNAPFTISERNIQSLGGRAGTSHRGYSTGESRGH